MPTTKPTKEAAQMIGVSVGTMRNWSDQYAVFLSETARPGHLPERRFTDKDLTILTYVKALRDEGLQVEQIRERLSETTFQNVEIIQQQATTEADKLQQIALEVSPSPPDTHSAAPVAIVLLDDLEKRIDAKIAAVQQAARPSWWWFALGLGAGLGLAVVAELFALVARR